jgi:hypothetical protein
MSETTGRFNWLTVRPDNYEVLFKPMRGIISITVAKELSREQAIQMMQELNEVIDDFRKDFNED